MKRESPFKYVFWSLLVVIVLLVLAVFMIFLARGRLNYAFPPLMGRHFIVHPLIVLPFLIIFAYIAIVGRLVYKDAAKRGMDPWLWATVAVFVPNLIGLIIYLIMRQTIKNVCVNCGKGIQKDFKICPYCGHKQELLCGNCQNTVAPDWSVCPFCAQPLPKEKPQS